MSPAHTFAGFVRRQFPYAGGTLHSLGGGERNAAEPLGALLALLFAEREHHHRQQPVLLELLDQALPLVSTTQQGQTRHGRERQVQKILLVEHIMSRNYREKCPGMVAWYHVEKVKYEQNHARTPHPPGSWKGLRVVTQAGMAVACRDTPEAVSRWAKSLG